MKSIKTVKGFTLVELAIVIVIIGLIVAGVVAGQNLVKQAQLRSIISEQEKIKSALNAFKLQYDAIPGDMLNARTYWTSCGSSDAECNGDGDKTVELNATDHLDSETYRAWQHLTLSGIYPGSYTGTGKDATDDDEGVIGVNIPKSSVSTAGISLIYDDSNNSSPTSYDSTKNIILFGGAVSSDLADGAVFTASEGLSIDNKVDDGRATTGILLGGAANCDNSGAYDVATSGNICNLAFTF